MRRLALAAALLAVSMAPAAAQYPQRTSSGFYVSIQGGAMFAQDSRIGGPAPVGGSDITWRTGWAAGGAIGYTLWNLYPNNPWLNQLRIEFEGGHRYTEAQRMYGGAAAGRFANSYGMFNLLYDIPTGLPLTPYVGFGLGASSVFMQVARAPVGGLGPTDFRGRNTAFAFQGIAGVSAQITENWIVGVDYRFFGTPAVRIAQDAGIGDSRRMTNLQHTVMASVRYQFGVSPSAPPPPPPAAPPPRERVAQQGFIVYFDFNRSTLRPDAIATIRDAAAVILAGGVARMTILSGHADTVGNPAYNQRLSQARSDAVRNQLMAFGVPANVITSRAFGEGQLLIATPDQTREQQNRRVEIVVQ